ncbi:MAG TPA: response regulator transcription factor [Ardenticatenaceae bacterium]|nr:response regulator transcription factor [Ardenticatenaceae bacterium]
MYALLISHDSDEIAILSQVLQCAGREVVLASDPEEALARWSRAPGDLVVVATGEDDLVETVGRVRAAIDAPVLAIAGSPTAALDVAVRDAGADDLLAFSGRRLVTHVRTLLRRVPREDTSASSTSLTLGDVTLDTDTRSVKVAGSEPVRLAPLEYRLLRTLVLQQGQPLSSRALIECVWGSADLADDDMLRGVVRRLRRRIEPSRTEARYVVNVPGRGYALRTGERRRRKSQSD